MGDVVRVSLAEAKAKLSELIRTVEGGDPVTITVAGRPSVTMSPASRPARQAGRVGGRDWVLVDDFAEALPFPFSTDTPAGKRVDDRRGRGEGGGLRHDSAVWLNLSTGAAVVAYPTAGWGAYGRYEFVHSQPDGQRYWSLPAWDTAQDRWDGDPAAAERCYEFAMEFGSAMLGAEQPGDHLRPT